MVESMPIMIVLSFSSKRVCKLCLSAHYAAWFGRSSSGAHGVSAILPPLVVSGENPAQRAQRHLHASHVTSGLGYALL